MRRVLRPAAAVVVAAAILAGLSPLSSAGAGSAGPWDVSSQASIAGAREAVLGWLGQCAESAEALPEDCPQAAEVQVQWAPAVPIVDHLVLSWDQRSGQFLAAGEVHFLVSTRQAGADGSPQTYRGRFTQPVSAGLRAADDHRDFGRFKWAGHQRRIGDYVIQDFSNTRYFWYCCPPLS